MEIRTDTRAWLVWGSALAAYIVAVLNRSSFGIAGVEAAERFGVGATVISTFVVVQLSVYALMQVPVGVLLDRFGSRTLIAAGALLMATGQLLLSLVTDLPAAYVARVLIGAGDAATFISVVRLVSLWFPPRRVPVLTQLSGIIGSLGQIVAAVPLVAVLHAAGWQTAFGGLAAIGVLAACLVVLAVRDTPEVRERVPSMSIVGHVRGVIQVPGTRLGFWSHALTQFPVNVFLLLWGFPFLTQGEGLAPSTASALFTVCILASITAGPVIGVFTGRHPLRRSWIVLAAGVTMAAAWTAVLLQPGPSPLWLLVVLVVVLGIGGPGSMIGFDYARTFNERARIGAATGLVNVGGFAAAVVSVLAIGIVLDVYPGPALSLDAFRVAFSVMIVPWGVSVAGVLVERRRTRAHMAAQGVQVPTFRQVIERRRGAST
ncbi:nitrate/nitrite transporter [Actinotalea sp.]|uniref:MFS transporter n=1 Tax=Actinotalea sp. TaxID=1872145 RepID=UPI003566E25C